MRPPAPSSAPGVSQPGSAWRLSLRLLALAWRYRGGCLLILVLSAADILSTVAGIRLLGLGIDFLQAQSGTPPLAVVWPLGLAPPAELSPSGVIMLLAALILIAGASALLFRYLTEVTAAWLMQGRLVVDLRRQVFAKLQQLDFAFFDNREAGSLIQRVTTDVQGAREFVEVVVLQSITVVISLFIYLLCLLSIHVPLTLACLATMPLMALLIVRFSRRVRPAYAEGRRRMDELVRRLIETVQGIQVVKAFGMEGRRTAAFAAGNRAVLDQKMAIFQAVARLAPAVNTLMGINMLVLLLYGGHLVIAGELGVGSGLVVFAGLLGSLSDQINSLAAISNSLQNSLSGAERVFEVLDAPLEMQEDPDALPLPQCRGEVRFEAVRFAYPQRPPVLRDLSFVVEAGQRIAIFGPTGAGKTSLLSLIPRFYDPAAGRVLLDGIDLRQVRLSDLRRQIGIVFQESFLFSTSVAENIAFGRPGASRAEVEAAARIAAADTFIRALPQGYETVIGERGATLSGGQRQRLAIARAVLGDPAILILDDATAAIDAQTEAQIRGAMEAAMRGRTTFIVAHRLATLQDADLILVMDRGQIVERGRHAELLERSAFYRSAAELQRPGAESQRLLARDEDRE